MAASRERDAAKEKAEAPSWLLDLEDEIADLEVWKLKIVRVLINYYLIKDYSPKCFSWIKMPIF